jgi:putative ABC transport system permease protein
VLASLGAALAGAGLAVRRAVRIAPAVAMRPPAPLTYRRSLLDRIGLTWLLGAGGRMVLRNVLRRPVRSGLTALGVAFSLALLVSNLFLISSLERMLEVFFHDTQYQDVTVTFVETRGQEVRHELAHLPGVIAVDLARSVPVRLVSGPRSERMSLTGRDADAQLTRVLDENEEQIALPETGLALSAVTAEELGVGAGDTLRVEVLSGRRPVLEVPLTLVMRDYIGTSAYMTREALNRALGDPPSADYADLAVDPADLDALYAELTDSPMVLGVSRREAGLERLRALIDESLVVSILIYIGFAAVIAVGVVYNSARIALAERGRELASMRVLGYHRREVALLLVGELAVLVAIALPVGCVLGYFVAYGLVQQFGSDLFRLPFVITPPTYAWASLVIIAASIAAALIVVRRVRRLDLIAVLKTRE